MRRYKDVDTPMDPNLKLALEWGSSWRTKERILVRKLSDHLYNSSQFISYPHPNSHYQLQIICTAEYGQTTICCDEICELERKRIKLLQRATY